MRNAIRPPRFYGHRHVKNWVSDMLRAARAAYGDSYEYHMIVKRVMFVKRKAMRGFKNA